ncbi:Spo0B domain-containing protein [Heliorestis convoluta]|uniref:SpoOB alpha-helical domain-containing protein n=1 Tax=Heliorestis convoluta TaxID=356322 RepID=A0A5Q2MX68_9FIRM|nr:Spo0B domain-containing protein [Heliorestis convoluta]QGG47244.1 hypothetical protein FTV88_1097 [Heliorestis convoluta]
MGNINDCIEPCESSQSELWLEVWREMRHDFINHLQIILGYVQLGRAEKANHYLKDLAAKIRDDGQLTALGVMPLIVMLIHKMYSLRKEEILLQVTVQDNWRPEEWQSDEEVTVLLRETENFIQSLLLHRKTCHDGADSLCLFFHGGQEPYVEAYWLGCFEESQRRLLGKDKEDPRAIRGGP